jgi:RND family efflux transporter MFP subunit
VIPIRTSFRPSRSGSSWALAIALASLAAAGCGESRADGAADPTPQAIAPVPVRLAPVTQVPVDRPLRVTGRVVHARDTKPAFKTGGLIAEIHVDEGMRVVAGQLLATLDTRELDAGLAGARAGLAKARRDLARAKDLAADDALPTAVRDDAETAATVARAQVAGLAWNRETTRLVAAHPGVVVKRLAEPGEVVGPGQPVLVIGEAAPDAVRVEVAVPARARDRAGVGTEAWVTLDGAGQARRATVVEVAPTLTPGTDRIAVTLLVEGTAVDAPRGLTATAVFAPRPAWTATAIPLRALVEGAGREASVWVPGPDGRATRRDVIIGEVRPDGFVTILSGLDGVTEVVDAGQAWLDADARIVVVDDGEVAR